jgi:hypothetical protein
VKPVKYIDSSPGPLSETGWGLLAELELQVDAEADSAVSTWLAKTLDPLKLHTDFLSKVTKSAQDAAVRAITSERAQMEFGHAHLRLFVSKKKVSELGKQQTWGFFRIEKLGTSTENGEPHDHSIEFYLYLEG